LAALSRSAGLSSSTLANALSRPWPKGEWIIANALKVHPAEIWPSRYYHPETNELMERKMRGKLAKDPNLSTPVTRIISPSTHTKDNLNFNDKVI
jgi:Ner family transcriptional regulator